MNESSNSPRRGSRSAARGVRPRRWRRRVRALFILFLLVLGSLYGTYRYLSSPTRVHRLAVKQLREMLGAQVTIGGARFEQSGRVVLEDVRMRVPGIEGEAGRLAQIQRADVMFAWAHLLAGHKEPAMVTLVSPTVFLCEDVETGRFNFQTLQRQRADEPVAAVPDSMPEVFIVDGRAVFGRHRGVDYTRSGGIAFGGSLMADPMHAGVYRFLLRQTDAQLEQEPVLSGKIELPKLRVDGTVKHFGFDQPQRNLLPAEIRAWWDRLEPAGKLPTVMFSYSDAQGFTGQIDVRNLDLTIPYDTTRRGTTRLRDVSGRFAIERGNDSDAVTVRWENVRGTLVDPSGSAEYTINGAARGSGWDAPFNLDVRVTGTTEDAPQALAAMPEVVQENFWRYAPRGNFDLAAKLDRAEPGGRIRYRGDVTLTDATIVYSGFPYELHNARAEFAFDESLVTIKRIDAVGETGAAIHVEGTIADPGPGSEVKIQITARDVPVDRTLFNVLEPYQRRALALFFDVQAHRDLVRRGVIREPGTPAPPANESGFVPPVFEMGGTIGMDVGVHRLPGDENIWKMRVELTPEKPVNLVFRFWPYPFTATAGKLVIDNDGVHAEDIRIRGLSGATAAVDGSFLKDRENRVWRPDLTVTGRQMPVDELLLATIASPQDKWLRTINIDGAVDARARVFLNDRLQYDYRVTAEITGGTATPNRGKYTLEGVEAKTTIGPGFVRIDSAGGKHGESEIDIDGELRWGKGEPTVKVNVRGDRVQAADPIADLIPDELPARAVVRDLVKRYDPAGEFGFSLGLDMSDKPDYTLTVEPRTLAFNLRDQRIKLHDMSGRVVVTPDRTELKQLKAAWDHGWARADGVVELGENPMLHLAITGEAEATDPTVRVVLPEGALTVIDDLHLQGAYKLEDAKLHYTTGGDGVAKLAFRGDMQLRDGRAEVGLPLTELDGKATLVVDHRSDQRWPRVSLKLQADRLRAADRVIAPMRMTVSNSEQPQRFVVSDLVGSVYNGSLFGSGEVEMGKDMLYSVQLVLQDADLAPVVRPIAVPDVRLALVEPAAPARGDDAGLEGTLSASVSLEGVLGDLQSRRGRGEIRVRDAVLYRTPLSLAILQVLNLNWPSEKHFNRAEASYLVDGDIVRFDRVRFGSPRVELVGRGRMRYSTLDLDMHLVTRHPESEGLGAVGEAVNILKDELLSIKIDGTLKNPRARVQSFPGFTRTWEEIFGKPIRQGRRDP